MPLVSNPDATLKGEDGVEYTPMLPPSSSRRAFEEVPSNREMQKQHVRLRIQLADLPLPPKQMNLVSLICMYTMMGLNDLDIALATGLEPERIDRIKMLDAYTTVYQSVIDSIVSDEAEDVRMVITANAKKAINTVTELLSDEFSAIRLSAAKDILDRAGHRPVDIIEHKHTMDGELRISVTREEDLSKVGVPLDAEGL